MEYVVSIDERGRIVLPAEVRRRLGLKGKRKVLIRVRDDDVVELIVMDKIYNDIVRVFEEKFKNWREEDHEASTINESDEYWRSLTRFI